MAHRSAGFTLVELLVSLAIMAMLSVLIVSGVGGGARVWERMDRTTAAGEAVEGAQAALRTRLERIFPATRYDASTPYVDFDGAADSLAFIAPPADAARPAPLRRYHLALTAAGDLVLSSHSDLAANPAAPDPEQLVLLHGVQGIELAYFGPTAPDNSPRWRPRWTAQPAPPQLVRLRVAFAADDRRWWPDLVVKPAADIDAGCVMNSSGRCMGRT